eukprot:jgi/Bigna1/71008/fgenesh1_pg.14_\
MECTILPQTGFSASDVTRSPKVKALLAMQDGVENLKRLTEFRRAKVTEWSNRHNAAKKGKRLKPSQKHGTFMELSRWMDRQCIKARCKMELHKSAMKALPHPNCLPGAVDHGARAIAGGELSGSDCSSGITPNGDSKARPTTGGGSGKKSASTHAKHGSNGGGGMAVVLCNRSQFHHVVVESYLKGEWRPAYVLASNQKRVIRANQRCVILEADYAGNSLQAASLGNGSGCGGGGYYMNAGGYSSSYPQGGAVGSSSISRKQAGPPGRMVVYMLSLRPRKGAAGRYYHDIHPPQQPKLDRSRFKHIGEAFDAWAKETGYQQPKCLPKALDGTQYKTIGEAFHAWQKGQIS